MYCEKCDVFYDDDTDVCKVCGKKLVDFHPIMNEEDAAELDMLKTEDDAAAEASESLTPEKIIEKTEPEVLVSINEKEDAEHIIAILEANMIPAFSREGEEGETTDILVPAHMIPQGLEILNETVPDIMSSGEEELSDEELDELLSRLADETGDIEV